MRRRAVALPALALTAVVGLSFAVPARSDDMKEQCAKSFEDGQRLRREGKLRAARKELVICAADACPEIIAPACGKWLVEVDAAMPTIVVVARGPKGDQIGDVKVLVDGEVVTTSLDGRPLPIDPGKHRMRYETAGAEPIEDDVIINVGDHNRRLEPTFRAPGSDPPPGGGDPPKTKPTDPPDAPGGGPVRWPAYLTIGLGGGGILLGAITGGIALGAKNALDDACATKTSCPRESQEDIDTLTTMSTVSTVGFVVGGVVAAAGIIVVIALPKGSDKRPAATAEAYVSPLGAGVRGAF